MPKDSRRDAVAVVRTNEAPIGRNHQIASGFPVEVR